MTRSKSKPADLEFEQIEVLANFSEYAADYPILSFEEIAKKLGVDFSASNNGNVWEKECREGFDRERAK